MASVARGAIHPEQSVNHGFLRLPLISIVLGVTDGSRLSGTSPQGPGELSGTFWTKEKQITDFLLSTKALDRNYRNAVFLPRGEFLC